MRFAAVLTLILITPGLSSQVGDNWPGRDLFENHGAIKLLIDPTDGAIVAANAAARAFYSFPSLLEMRIGQINLLTEVEVADEMSRAAVAERNHFFFRHATGSKGVRDVEVYSYPVAVGAETYLYSIIIDVTDRLIVEEQLRVFRIRVAAVTGAVLAVAVLALIFWALRTGSRLRATSKALATTEEVYRSYVNGAPLGVFVADETGRYREVNPEACRITGYSEEELLAMSIADLIIPEHHGLAEDHFRTVLRDGRSAGEMAFATRTGEIRWWNVVAAAISRNRFLEFTEDITDRKTAEQHRFALVKAAEELQSCTPETVNYSRIAETARNLTGAFCAAVNLFDADGKSFTTAAMAGIPHHIARAGDMLGFSLTGRRWSHDPLREAALGDAGTIVFPSLGSLASGNFTATLAEGIASTFDLGEVVITRVMTAAGTLGDVTLLFSSGDHLRNRDLLEIFAGMVGVTLARIRTEEQNARLVQEKETLLKEVQHRVKNNMNTMTSLLSLQAHQVRGTRVAEGVLNDACSRFRSMEILYDRLYRSDVHNAGSVHEYLRILVPQVVDLFPAASRVAVTVQVDGDACRHGECCNLDAKRLSMVGLIVNELVTNAMKYAFAGDHQAGGDNGPIPAALTVTTSCMAEMMEIRVEDNGPGLPAAFDEDNPSGFGLMMVQAMVSQLDGAIRYESPKAEDNPGTRVVVTFPRGFGE
ncbi:MAG: PAS domain S-box protein [Spirochaetaceae bacterium]|nr:MAG: PAS domain S-box protein [Spirochaetaceae bacterium]